jgi:phenylalanyl-tRNA synthetase beta chain
METGQPLHFFDTDKIEGNKVIIRKAKEKEKFTTLDEIDRELSSEDLMICDSMKPMCIAGVFGGMHSGVTENTRSVFIESAWFDPPTIRKTAKRHTLQTDASFRFERGSDIEMTVYALKRAALLIKEIAGGEISSEINDVYPTPLARNIVEINYQRVFSLIGKTFSTELVKEILESLDIMVLEENNEGLKLEVPTAKVEVTREADIVEEILRVYGYNNIELSHEVRSALSYMAKPNPEKVKNRVADMLSANGFNEIMNNSLTAEAYYENTDTIQAENHVKMLNPLSKELNILRRTLLFSGLEVIAYNQNRKITDLKLYEFGKSYHFNNSVDKAENVRQRYTENSHLSMFLSGNITGESWYKKAQEVTFFDLKNHLFKVLHKAGIDTQNLKEVPTEQPWYAEGIDIKIKKKTIATIGKLAKKYQKQFDINQAVFYAEIDWDFLMSAIPKGDTTMTAVPKFPEVRRDLALLVDKSVSFRDITNVVKQNGGALVKDVNLFDVYEGDKLEAGKKSYAISVMLQDPEKTLTEKLIDKTMNKLIGAFEHKIGATIR